MKQKGKKFNEYIEQIMSSDIIGVNLPLIGAMRRSYPAGMTITRPASGGVQKYFIQPTYVSVKNMTKTSFKDAQKSPFNIKRKMKPHNKTDK